MQKQLGNYLNQLIDKTEIDSATILAGFHKSLIEISLLEMDYPKLANHIGTFLYQLVCSQRITFKEINWNLDAAEVA